MSDTYEAVRSGLKTGDILLFSGKGAISTWIKRFTRSKWSHVGMVVRVPEYDMTLCWESTTLSNVRDLDSGDLIDGVQLVPLRERLRVYDGEVIARPLAVPLVPEQTAALGRFRSEVCGRRYEASKMELLRSAYDGWGGQNKEDLSTLFCSELVAEAYQRMGLLPETIPSNEWTPADFEAGGAGVDEYVEYLEEIPVKLG